MCLCDWLYLGKNIDGSTVEVCLAKPIEKGAVVRWTRSPASGKLSPAVSCITLHYIKCYLEWSVKTTVDGDSGQITVTPYSGKLQFIHALVDET